jgi:hypothetical protein
LRQWRLSNGAYPVAHWKTYHPNLPNRSTLKTAHNNWKYESCAAARDAARGFHKRLSPQANQANGVIKITDDPIKVRQIESLIR